MHFLFGKKQVIEKIGRKAHNLMSLKSIGFNVKNGVVISNKFVESIYFKDKLLAEKTVSFITNKLDSKYFIIRSSAIDEDGTEYSFAGHFYSKPLVTQNQLLEGLIDTCKKNIEIAKKNNQNSNVVAIFVQEMVLSEFSGVAFTCHPVTGEKKAIIEFVRGNSFELVNGKITPNRISFDYDTLQIEANNTDTIKILGVTNLIRIIEEIVKLKKLFDSEQDIEWSIESKTNLVFINQIRPLTSTVSLIKPSSPISNKFSDTITGEIISNGLVVGKPVIINDLKELNSKLITKNSILVLEFLSPSISHLFKNLKNMKGGVICEKGGILSHSAIIAREYKIPVISQIRNARKILKSKTQILLDANNGKVMF